MLSLTILGSGGGMPMPDRFLSSQLIQYKGRKLLVDCGEGTQVAMRKFNTGFKSLDILCFSHLHGDHIFGLPGLLMTMGNSGRTETVTIIGPEGIKEAVGCMTCCIPYLPFNLAILEKPEKPLSLFYTTNGLTFKAPDQFCFADLFVSTVTLDHTSPCIGYSFEVLRKPKFLIERALAFNIPQMFWKRLQKGEVVFYEGQKFEPDMVLGDSRQGLKLCCITDTRPIPAIIDFIRGSDLFICEGTYGADSDWPKAEKNKHMTFEEAAILAQKGEVKKLLLTHLGSGMDHPEDYKPNAAQIFPHTTIGYDGLKMEFKF